MNDKWNAAHVVIMQDGKALLLKRTKNDCWMPGKYGLPGGKSEPGETMLEAAIREVKEETNLDIREKELTFLDKISKKHDHCYFSCNIFSGDVKIDHESDDFGWFSVDEIKKLETTPKCSNIVVDAMENS